MGHMVRDALAAVDALQCLTLEGRANQTRCGTGAAHGGSYPSKLGKIPPIDGGKIVLAGYSLGGNVALHAAATAPPSAFAAVAAFAAFTPYRTDTNDRPTGGLRRLYEMHALLPRLGLFAADPREVPYDYDELLTSLAPRPTLLHTPTQDRDATHADVAACVAAAAGAWPAPPGGGGGGGGLNHSSAETGTQMAADESALLISWLEGVVGWR